MGREVEVAQVKTAVDRTLATKGQVRLWESLLPSLDRVSELRDETVRLRSIGKSDPASLSRRRVKLASIDLEYRMIKETVLDRTLPVLARVDVAAVMALLPRPESESAVVDQATDEQRAKAESVALLHAVIAKLSNSSSSARPGLVLIRRDGAA